MSKETLLKCLGYHGHSNQCEGCEVAKACRKVVAKDRLQAILNKIERLEALLKKEV